MTDKQKIKEEIERRMNNLWYLIPEGEKVLKDDFTKDDANNLGKYTALESLLKFIDSLSEKNKKDFSERYSDIVKSEEFKEVYHGKSLGRGETIVEHEWVPRSGDIFRKKGTNAPLYQLCTEYGCGMFSFVQITGNGVGGGEISKFLLQEDFELVERNKPIEEVIEEEISKSLSSTPEDYFDCAEDTVSTDGLDDMWYFTSTFDGYDLLYNNK